jgi:hypothetical protein
MDILVEIEAMPTRSRRMTILVTPMMGLALSPTPSFRRGTILPDTYHLWASYRWIGCQYPDHRPIRERPSELQHWSIFMYRTISLQYKGRPKFKEWQGPKGTIKI